MPNVLEISEQLWRGEISAEHTHPMAPHGELVEVASDTAFVSAFANVSAFRTKAGLVLMDTGSQLAAQNIYRLIRAWSHEPLHTAIYSPRRARKPRGL